MTNLLPFLSCQFNLIFYSIYSTTYYLFLLFHFPSFSNAWLLSGRPPLLLMTYVSRLFSLCVPELAVRL